jgi:hypothetical protein
MRPFEVFHERSWGRDEGGSSRSGAEAPTIGLPSMWAMESQKSEDRGGVGQLA